MQTLTANWLAAFASADIELRMLVKVWTGSASSTLFSDGECTQFETVASVLEVSEISRELDVIEHKTTVGECNVSFANDGVLAALITSAGLAFSGVEISIGTRTMALADFAPYFAGVITHITTSATQIDVSVSTREILTKKLQSTRVSLAIPKHPLEHLADIFELATGLPLEDSDHYTDTTTSHLVCDLRQFVEYSEGESNNRTIANGLLDPAPVIDNLLICLDGNIACLEDGLPRYIPTTNTTIRTWTDDDVIEFTVDSLYDNLVNRVVVLSHPNGDGYESHLSKDDTSSQTRYSHFDGGTNPANVREKRIELRIGLGKTVLTNNISAAYTGALRIWGDGVPSTCGTYWGPTFPSGSQDALDKASASRLMYLQAGARWEWAGFGNSPEVIEVDSSFVYSTSYQFRLGIDLANSIGASQLILPDSANMGISARGALGTTASAQDAWNPETNPDGKTIFLLDVTIPVLIQNRILARFADGCPVVDVKTHLSQMEIQLGDIVTVDLDAPDFAWFSYSDMATVKWQVIGKTVSPHGDQPHIAFRLAYRSRVSPTTQTLSWLASALLRNGPGVSTRPLVRDASTVAPTVRSGLDVQTTTGSDTVSLTTGIVQAFNRNLSIPATTLGALPASSDVYVLVDANSGALLTREVSIGDPEPRYADGEIPVGYITTDAGSTVVSVADLRPTIAASGAAIEATAASIAEEAVGPFHVKRNQQFATGIPNGDIDVLSRAVASFPPDGFFAGYTITSGATYVEALDEAYSEGAIYGQNLNLWAATGEVVVGVPPRTGQTALWLWPQAPSSGENTSFAFDDSYDTPPTPTRLCTLDFVPRDGTTLVLRSGGKGGIASIAQRGMLWTQATFKVSGSGNVTAEIWYGRRNLADEFVTQPPSSDILVTFSTGYDYGQAIHIDEWAGIYVAAADPLDGTASANGSSTTGSTGSVTPTEYGTILIGAVACAGESRVFSSPTAGWTLSGQFSSTAGGDPGNRLALVQRAITTAAANSCSLTIDSSAEWAGCVAAFERWPDPGFVTRPIPCTEDDCYEAEFDVMQSDSGSLFAVEAQWSDDATAAPFAVTRLASLAPPSPVGGYWYRYRFPVQAPAGGHYVRLALSSSNTSTGYTFCDRVRLIKVGPSFRAYRSGSNQSVASGSFTKVQFQSELHDYGTRYDASTNYQFTAPYAGDYAFEASVQIDALDAAKYAILSLYKNGSELKRGMTAVNGTAGSLALSLSVSVESTILAAGDTIDVRIYHNHGSNRDVVFGSELTSFSGRGRL